jgi:hypothetical protein
MKLFYLIIISNLALASCSKQSTEATDNAIYSVIINNTSSSLASENEVGIESHSYVHPHLEEKLIPSLIKALENNERLEYPQFSQFPLSGLLKVNHKSELVFKEKGLSLKNSYFIIKNVYSDIQELRKIHPKLSKVYSFSKIAYNSSMNKAILYFGVVDISRADNVYLIALEKNSGKWGIFHSECVVVNN